MKVNKNVGWLEAYNYNFPKVNIWNIGRRYYVAREQYNENEVMDHYITSQPSLDCINAWLEGAVKGICKPSIMFE